MRIEQMQYIVEIARTGSISLAATRMNVSQPNVSQAVVALEDELGVKLFNRSRSGAHPTEAGKTIIGKAQDILNRLDELKKTANVHSSLLTGRLSVAGIPTVCMSLLPRVLAVFKSNYPHVELEIIEDSSNQILLDVQNGHIDLGIVGLPLHRIDRNLFRMDSFMKSKIMACVGKNTVFAHQKTIQMKDIIAHPVLSTSEYVQQTLAKYGKPNLLFKSKNLEASKRVIAEGLAIGFYTDWALKFDPYVLSGEMIPLRITDEDLELSFFWIQSKKTNPVAAEQFLEEMMKQVDYLKRLYNLE